MERTVVTGHGRRLGEWLWRVRCGVASGSLLRRMLGNVAAVDRRDRYDLVGQDLAQRSKPWFAVPFEPVSSEAWTASRWRAPRARQPWTGTPAGGRR